MSEVMDNPAVESPRWTEHPLVDRLPGYARLSDEDFCELADRAGVGAALSYYKAREKKIADSVRDPCRHEFALPHWADVENMVKDKIVTFIPGGNNPGKSWWAGSLVMRFLMRRFMWPTQTIGKLRVLMIAQDDDASKMFQQPAVYAHMPVEWRKTNEAGKKPAGFARCINYGEKNGFTEGSFVLPRPLMGQCWFKTVAQYVREPQSFEGPAYDLVIIDEGCPIALFRSLLGRVAKVGGRIVYLLTCLHGYDATMGVGLEGATITKTLPMNWDFVRGGVNPDFVFPELKLGEHQTDYLRRLGCPAGHLPYMMQPLNPHLGVIFMWSTWNPFQPRSRWNPKMPSICDAAVGRAKWQVIVMLFGWTERVGQLALGNFNPETHVLRGEKREAMDKMVREGKATVYVGDDPETQRSHAILWLAVFEDGTKYLFDESPRNTEGEWVNVNGERGDGQYVYARTGANFYKRYMREREQEWNVCEVGMMSLRTKPLPAGWTSHERLLQRRGDPRGFATEESTAIGTRSLFDLFLEDYSDEHAECYPMVFTPAKIRRQSSLDIDNIITLLRYDEERAQREGGLSVENRPQLYVSERCANFIRCALNYTLTDLGKADEENPFKDFIDAARYLFSADTPYIAPDSGADTGGGAWG